MLSSYSNYIAAIHNVTHSPCTSTCTPHPALHTPLPSTTFLCTQLTNTKHSRQNGTRCRDGVKLLWCHSHLVWLVIEGSIPMLFIQKTFCDIRYTSFTDLPAPLLVVLFALEPWWYVFASCSSSSMHGTPLGDGGTHPGRPPAGQCL